MLASLDIVNAVLKHKNILVLADKIMGLADLGRSLVARSPTMTHGIRGPRFYASHEILRQSGITPAAEVFSLGVGLFEWASGQLRHTALRALLPVDI